MSGNLLKKGCLRKNQSYKADSFAYLFESLRLIRRAIKDASMLTFTVKSYKHVVLRWREHISQSISKLKDDMESLNTNDVISVILKIQRENSMKPIFNLKFDVFSNTFYL